MTIFHRRSTFTGIALLAAMLGACGGGSSQPPPISPPPIIEPPPEAPDNPIVYLASDDTTGMTAILELYLIDPATPGESAKINAPLVAGGSLDGAYSLSPDLTQAAYIANQDSVNEWALYLVDLAEPGTATKVNGPLIAGGEVVEFTFSPDGDKIAYVADQDVFGQYELYLVDLASPGTSERLNADLPVDGDVRGGFSFSPDGSQVLYIADQEVEGVVDLFVADVAAPGTTTKVNPTFVDGGDITGTRFAFSPDGATIVYIADQDVNSVDELYAVDVGNLGVSAKLNPTLVAEGDLCTFRFSPDSTKVAYCADQDVVDTLELYVVELAVPGVSMKVNEPLVAGGDVQAATFLFGPDSDFLVYRADQEVDGDNELYRVDLATPGVSAKINEALPAGGDVSFFDLAPDGLQVVYAADQDTEGVADLYAVDLSTPGASNKLNPPAVGPEILQIDVSAEGTQVVYLTDHETSGKFELQRVDIASAGVATRMNSDLPDTGDIFHFVTETGLSF